MTDDNFKQQDTFKILDQFIEENLREKGGKDKFSKSEKLEKGEKKVKSKKVLKENQRVESRKRSLSPNVKMSKSASNFKRSPRELQDKSDKDKTRAIPIDGRQLFKMVKQTVSSEKFNCFLQVIKQLNSHQITKQQALSKLRDDVFVNYAELVPVIRQLINP